jgi:glycosyltransferase involved in cell wall biosynthesis
MNSKRNRKSPMLRVAMITDHADDADKVDGGVQAVTKYLVSELIRHTDLDLHILTFNYAISESSTVNREGYTRHILPGARLGTVSAFLQDQRTLDAKLATIQPDIVHGQGAGHDGIVARRSRFPSVITIHGIMAEEAKHFTTLGQRARHRLLNMISEHYCIRNGQHTILISQYVADYFGDRIAGESHFIANPIASSYFDISRAEEPGRVLFAGRLIPLKGLLDLIRATATISQTERIQLVLAGSLKDQQYVDQLRRAAKQLGIKDQVHFPGVLDAKSLRKELSRASMLVLPSYQETAPMVIQEAMAAGVPVIASRVGGTRYQVRDGETGFLIAARDIQALTGRIGELLSNQAMRRSFGKVAKALAQQEYRADAVARKTIDIYRRILS